MNSRRRPALACLDRSLTACTPKQASQLQAHLRALSSRPEGDMAWLALLRGWVVCGAGALGLDESSETLTQDVSEVRNGCRLIARGHWPRSIPLLAGSLVV